MRSRASATAAVTTTEGHANTGTRTRNPLGEGARLRQELIAAAGRLLAGGVDPGAMSLRAVAREAGIAAPSVYLQFASKELLVWAVVEAHFALFQAAIEECATEQDDPASRLLAGCLAYCRFAEEHPGSYRIIFETPLHGWEEIPPEERPGIAAFNVLVSGVAGCIEAGVARPGDPFRIATDVWTALHGIVSLRRQAPGFSWPSLDAQVRGVVGRLTGITVAPFTADDRSFDDTP